MSSPQIRKLLITEDEPEIREILRAFLEPLSVEILEAANGVEALAVLQKESVDAIISDIAMPEMNGLELLSHLSVDYQPIPVVILTAFGDRENILEALRLGAIDFIEKPFSQENVIDVTTRALDIGVRNQRLELAVVEGAKNLSITELDTFGRDRRMSRLLRVKNNQERRKKRA